MPRRLNSEACYRCIACKRVIHFSRAFGHICEAIRIGLCTACYRRNHRNLAKLEAMETKAVVDLARFEDRLENILGEKGPTQVVRLKRLISDLEKERDSVTFIVRRQAKAKLRSLERRGA